MKTNERLSVIMAYEKVKKKCIEQSKTETIVQIKMLSIYRFQNS